MPRRKDSNQAGSITRTTIGSERIRVVYPYRVDTHVMYMCNSESKKKGSSTRGTAQYNINSGKTSGILQQI
jgi:hypothetical protein